MENLSNYNHNTCILLSLTYENSGINKSKCHLKYMWKDNLKTYNFKYLTKLNNIKINEHNLLICINMENDSNNLRKEIMLALKEDDEFIRSYDDGRKKTLLIPSLDNIERFIEICESFGVDLHYSGLTINNNNLMFNNSIIINDILTNREIITECNDNDDDETENSDSEYEPYDDSDDESDDESNNKIKKKVIKRTRVIAISDSEDESDDEEIIVNIKKQNKTISDSDNEDNLIPTQEFLEENQLPLQQGGVLDLDKELPPPKRPRLKRSD